MRTDQNPIHHNKKQEKQQIFTAEHAGDASLPRATQQRGEEQNCQMT